MEDVGIFYFFSEDSVKEADDKGAMVILNP
jgi:hypothetical protein